MKTSSQNLLDTYIKKINERIDYFFKNRHPRSGKFQTTLTDIIIECFHFPESKFPKETKALLILERALLNISQNSPSASSFNLTLFIKQHQLSQKDIKQLLIALIYGVFFNEIQFAKLQDSRDVEWLLIQTLAEKASRNKLKNILQLMSINQQIHLLAFIFKRYREGSFAILQTLKSICLSQRHHSSAKPYYTILLDLITGLTRKTFDVKTFVHMVRQATTIDEKILDEILTKLKTQARKNVQACFVLFNQLIPLMIDFPIRIYESLGKVKGRLKTALKQQKALRLRFQHYTEKNYTLNDFKALIAIIGLYGQVPYIQARGKQYLTSGLKDKIKFIYEIFKHPLAIARLAPSEILSILSFALTFISYLDAASRHFDIFQEGLDKLTCAIATHEKYLAKQASLESILEGFQISWHPPPIAVSRLKEIPIFVFDQSNVLLFEKNQKYIRQLNKRYHSSIIHISYDQAITLAKKIGIEKFLRTSDIKTMGYGGSRNCIFLLTPLLKHLFKIGKKTFSEVQQLDNKLLLNLFQQIVLHNSTKTNNTIFMLDDDIEIPIANIFSHALFAQQCENEYLYSHGFCVGRVTKYLNKFRDLQEILENPSQIFDFSQWVDIPFSIKMAEYVGKPKICLNLPLGQEEAHLKIECVNNPMLQISHHLGGTRYPSDQIPSHFFVGLETHLKKNIPYVLGVSLSMDLIDPSNISNRCILPWNDSPLSALSQCECLHDIFMFISHEKNKQEIQKRFWKNVRDVFHPTKGLSIPLRQEIDRLISMDVDNILRKFKTTHTLDLSEKRSLSAIGNLYKFHQQDALLFWEFGSELIKLKTDNIKLAINNIKAKLEKKHHILFIQYPTTYNFFLMCCSLGAGEFSSIVKATACQMD